MWFFCRDLKPENVLLAESWHILISDFGSAKMIGRDDNEIGQFDTKFYLTSVCKAVLLIIEVCENRFAEDIKKLS